MTRIETEQPFLHRKSIRPIRTMSADKFASQAQNVSSSNRNVSIQRLFRSTVTSSDRPVIEQFVNDAQKELKGCQTEIDKLRASLTSLEQKRDRLTKKLSQYRSLLSPVHRMPPEILRNVFTMLNPPRLLPSYETLAVSAVCGRWRDVVLAMPSFWSYLRIDFADWNKKYNALDRLVRLFMERSQTSPLELDLNFFKATNDVARIPDVIPTLETLVRYSYRWHRVKLVNGHAQLLLHDVFNPIKGRLPLLSHLVVFGFAEGLTATFHCDLFNDCPALTSVTLQPVFPFDADSSLPWAQIKSLVLLNGHSAPTFPMVSHCTNSNSLVLHWCGGDPYTGEHLVMPNVKEFYVVAAEDDDAYRPFQYLTLHNLSTLELSCREAPGQKVTWKNWEEQHITDFFIRSACTLTSLVLTYVPISDEELIRLLRLMPNLTSLYVEEPPSPTPANRTLTTRFLEQLVIDHKDGSLSFLPKLTNIEFILRDDGLSDSVLPKMLTSRWIPDIDYATEIGVDSIKSIDIGFISKSEDPINNLASRVMWMRSMGVSIYIGRYDEDAEEEVENDDDGGSDEDTDD
ncbi:hypothetical protein VNI00_012178 [Paramarasmius palmivorus]|uniref:F-box domain-containing protein n=1 Tax=Paramarasmius palmivorus TaxID=297713 RepID=A0AAW0C6B0_9AGAR